MSSAIYIDKDFFDTVVIDEIEFANITSALYSSSPIFLSIDDKTYDLEIEDEESCISIFLLGSACGAIPKSGIDIIDLILKDPLNIEKHSTDTFILNIETDKVKKIKSQFGVSLYSSISFEDTKFDSNELELVYKSEMEISIDDLQQSLLPIKTDGSNSLIINDRNLFSNEYNAATFRGDKDFKNVGVVNVIDILESILPDKLDLEYHVLILTEQNTDSQKQKRLNKAIIEVTNQIKELRDYSIIVEFIIYHASTKFFSHTHNRRLITNCHFGKVEHGFDLFEKKRSLKVKRDDMLQIANRFKRNSYRSQFMISLNRFLEIRVHAKSKLISDGQNDRAYGIYRDGQESNDVLNRLLTNP